MLSTSDRVQRENRNFFFKNPNKTRFKTKKRAILLEALETYFKKKKYFLASLVYVY